MMKKRNILISIHIRHPHHYLHHFILPISFLMNLLILLHVPECSHTWDAISPIFKFSKDVRTAFYTTNAIESLNASYRRLNRQRSVFTSSQALLKALYLATFEATKKWTMPIRNWGKVRGELTIMYPDRMPD